MQTAESSELMERLYSRFLETQNDPLGWLEEVEIFPLPHLDTETFNITEYSQGRQYKMNTYKLGEGYCNVVWDTCGEGKSCMQPFSNEVWATHTSLTYVDAMRWHHKVLKYLNELNPR